jgi:hypothetical protein
MSECYLDNQVSQHHFLLGDLGDPLFDRVLGDEAIDHDLVLLADTMGSRERLQEQKGLFKGHPNEISPLFGTTNLKKYRKSFPT